MNYKIKVANEAESKKAQELFFELGYRWIGEDLNSFYTSTTGWVYAKDINKTLYSGSAIRDVVYKEITLPELRDLVVLKRGDLNDATHKGDHDRLGFLSSDGKEYFWNFVKREWALFKVFNFKYFSFEEIEKTEMKEPTQAKFLVKTDDGYIVQVLDENTVAADCYLIPDGAETFNYFENEDNVFFLKSDGGEVKYSNKTENWTWQDWGDINFDGVVCLWQREPIDKNEQVLKEILDGGQDNVNQPSHYCSHPSGIECIEITRHHDFAIGNAIKYLWRAGLKDSANEIQDLEKAAWYIQDKINQLKK